MPTSWATSQRYPHEDFKVHGLSRSSLSSDSEDGEYLSGGAARIQPIHRRRVPDKAIGRKRSGARTSHRTLHYQHQTRVSSHISSSEKSGDVFVTTMDEDDQQMFIALFYWRRKVIETHFSAWKWVVFTLRRSAKQIHRHGIQTHPSKPTSAGPPRRNLILKRHTGRLSAGESETNQNSVEYEKPVQSFKRSLHDVDVEGLKEKSSPSPTNGNSVDMCSSEKRRQFRAELRLVYSCYGHWKSNIDRSRKRRMRQLIQASEFHRAQQLKSALQAWHCGTRVLELKRNRLNIADQFHRSRIRRVAFCDWKRFCRVEREILRRQNVNAALQKRSCFQHWYQCILQTRECRDFATNRCHNHLRITFKYFRDGVLRARRSRLRCVAAISHCQTRRQLNCLRSWRRAVFEDPSHLLSIDHGLRISLSSGLRKWRKFMNERQTRSRKVLLADFFHYRTFLSRAFRGWGKFLEWKRQRKLLYDDVQRYHQLTLELKGVQRLRAAVCANRIQQDQLRMATRWQQQKVATRYFTLWSSKAPKCGRIRSFRTGVDSRRLSCLFRSWYDQIIVFKSLKAKQLVVSKHWNGHILRTSMTKWARQQQMCSFISSLKLKRRNQSTANHLCAWRMWCNRKMSLKNVVEQQCQRRQAALLQRVLIKWVGVTLRKRCFKRLVKLFRKKQARHQVKSIFRFWKVLARVGIATRKRGQDRARLFLVEWKQACHKSKAKRVAIVVATQYYRERRYVVAVEQWSSFTGRKVRARKTEHRALSHYFQRIQISSLQRWYIAARDLRRQAEFLRHRQQLRDKQMLIRCLHDWSSVIRRRIQSRKQEWAALRFNTENLQRHSFYTWQGFVQARRTLLEKMCLAAVTYESSLQANVLQSWRLVLRESIQRKLKQSLVKNAVKRGRLQCSVTRLFNYRCERRCRRKHIATAETFFNENLLCLSMYHWQDLWFKASELRHKETKVARQTKSLHLKRAVSQWQENYRHSASIRKQKSKASQLYSKKILVKHLESWKCYHNAVHHKLSKRRLVTRLQHQKLLSRMFRRWHRYSEVGISARRQHHQAVQRQAASLIRLVFQSWKKYRSKRTLQLLAYFHRRRFVLQKIWTIWVSHGVYVATVRRNFLVTNQLLRSNLFLATFCRWKSYTSHRIERQIQRYRSEDHHVQWLYKRTVARWKKQTQFQHAVVQAALLGHINGARRFWRRCNDYIATKRTQKCKRVLAEQTYRQKRQRRHFTGWKTLTQRCVQNRREKSDALYRVSCLRMVWAWWHRVVGWRRCITTMEYRRLDYLQASMMQKWRAHTQFHVERKAKMAMATMFRQHKLRAKAWRLWLLYVSHCYEKQKRLEWILSYYSIEVLLRQSLASWKKLVNIQQAQRANHELAVSFNTHRLVYQNYRRWRTFVKLRKVQLEQSEAIFHKSEMLLLSRSVRRWRNRSAIWRQHHQYETKATWFYNKRRQECGLSKLHNWRDSQKNIRDLTIQARHLRNGRITAKHFRCWQRYHQWRTKYANLTRVFQQNQKGETFARWKLYWQKQQSMNEKRLQARVFHCVHVEQANLRAWMTFVRARKKKKLAQAFNTVKVYRAMFSFWKRRVQVLGQMRKMFLYQESFRTQTHFDAWKRYLLTRKQMNERLRKAMKFRDNFRKVEVWQKWSTWVSIKRQERETINLAVGFQQQFFSRKTFTIWRKRSAYWKHKRAQASQAMQHYQTRLVYRSFQALIDWRQTNMKLTRLEAELAAFLVEKRKRRVVANLLALCAERNRKQKLIQCACRHWQLCHQQKYWGCVMQWFSVAQHRKHQTIQAAAFARTQLLRRCMVAVRGHIVHINQVKAKVDAFRCRYFRSVADDCFYQWRAFISFKQKVRVLRTKTRQSERRQRLQQWRVITIEQVRRRAGMQQIAVKRRERELLCWFNHWESVCTDRWLDKELVLHHQRHAQKRRLQRNGLNQLQAQLPLRHERLKCKRFFLQHHKACLVQILQHWRRCSNDHNHNFNM